MKCECNLRILRRWEGGKDATQILELGKSRQLWIKAEMTREGEMDPAEMKALLAAAQTIRPAKAKAV